MEKEKNENMVGQTFLSANNNSHSIADSDLLINQITGSYRIRNKELLKLHKDIQSLKSKFIKFQAICIDRKLNVEADDVARRTLNRAMEK